MYSRNLNLPLILNKSFFLFGPRGTGKTTWIKNGVNYSVYIDLLEFEYYNLLLADPGRLENFIPPNTDKWIVLDEIQRIPELLNQVHRLIESKGYKFILTGSSARSLRKKGVNLLAGRALTFYMHPLTANELGNDFDINISLQFGHLPEIYNTPGPGEYLKSYIQTYLREEVLQEGLTRNLSVFTRFLEFASFSQGAALNISEMARTSGIGRKTVDMKEKSNDPCPDLTHGCAGRYRWHRLTIKPRQRTRTID